ncbi:hypothetical protein [Marinobacter sp. LV10MA510-1]|uniref:hypothetical protein n=1 Tax=Marinobacter sp. LV10MA510-1 TaxID=1415567 RepID=UPI000BF696FC|nr:hypothetical protein [Marinobacter sp. LV10MA510-1]PFG08594.1 hypothetical protein ATI45_0883 [Marinobacter sp. LV10MA510-1]
MISTISSQPFGVQNKYASLEKTGSGIEEKAIKDGASPENSNNNVTISDAGRKALEVSRGGQSPSYYEQFMPTYDGFTAANIALGVKEPDRDTFSAGKDFGQVAIDARASMDNNYERLESIGKSYPPNNAPAESRNSLLGELDRRALYAVASNQGEMFTKDEQAIARNKMNQQQGLAMGLYNGPTSEKDQFFDPFVGDRVSRFKAAIEFLDAVGNEEKGTSFEYAYQRAAVQRVYERASIQSGETPEELIPDSPLIRLLYEAMEAAETSESRSITEGLILNAEDIQKQSWFSGYESRLDDSINATRELYVPSFTK